MQQIIAKYSSSYNEHNIIRLQPPLPGVPAHTKNRGWVLKLYKKLCMNRKVFLYNPRIYINKLLVNRV